MATQRSGSVSKRLEAASPAKAAKAAPAKAAPAKAAKAAPAERPATGAPVAGSSAPAFEALDHDGKAFSSRSLAGRPFVLYFYPKDDTPGCTREACGFRDAMTELTRLGVTVLGVSPDSPASHARFRAKYQLPFALLADVERKIVSAYGVWVKKQNYGREYMGVERSTFLVGGDGKIRKVWRSVKVDGHVDAVLAAVRA